MSLKENRLKGERGDPGEVRGKRGSIPCGLGKARKKKIEACYQKQEDYRGKSEAIVGWNSRRRSTVAARTEQGVGERVEMGDRAQRGRNRVSDGKDQIGKQTAR